VWAIEYNFEIHHARVLVADALSRAPVGDHGVVSVLVASEEISECPSEPGILLSLLLWSNFLSEIVTELCRLMHVHQITTSSFHPETDGKMKDLTDYEWL